MRNYIVTAEMTLGNNSKTPANVIQIPIFKISQTFHPQEEKVGKRSSQTERGCWREIAFNTLLSSHIKRWRHLYLLQKAMLELFVT